MQSRRAVLTGLTAAGTTTLAGCTDMQSGPRSERAPVTILAAGSLTTALEHGLTPIVDTPIRIGTRGSAALARLIAAGTRSPAIVSVADPTLFDGPLHPDWYATFATNAIVLAYNPTTPGGRSLADASHWWQPLLDGNIRLGRTDPTLDPLGYRTLFTLELTGKHYSTAPALRQHLPTRDQVYPEPQLLAQFETGGIDAAFTYRNMAIERDYPYIELPSAINLSDPTHTQFYETATYTLPSGKQVTGDVIRYAATIHEPDPRPAVRSVFDAHIDGAYLDQFGFGRPNTYPEYRGDVPPRLPS